MKLVPLAAFDVVHRQLSWPWIALDPTGGRFAFASAAQRITTRVWTGEALVDGPAFALPADLPLPAAPPPPTGRAAGDAGLRAFAVDPRGEYLAFTGVVGGASVVVTCDARGERARSKLEDLAGPGFVAHALAFDRGGASLWLSAESATQSGIWRIDARSHALVGLVTSAPFPPPAMHELHVHPLADAVLLLASCGEDGTFARVVQCSGGRVESVPSALDAEGAPAGFVGFSGDGTRLHLAEYDLLRTHAWPGLHELSSVPFDPEFVSNYTGAVVGDRIFVDGEEAESGDDAVMEFEKAAIRGELLSFPVPSGMWVGRLGVDVLITVESKGDPAEGRVLRLA